MKEDFFPLNEEERRNKEMYNSKDRSLLFGSPMTVPEYEALPEKYRVLDEAFARYNTKDEKGFYHLNPIYTPETGHYVAVTRSLRYTLPFLHQHNCVEIAYVYRGTCRHYIDGGMSIMREGDFCIIGPDTVHAVENTSDDDILLSFMISREFFGTSFLNLLRNNQKISEFFERVLSHRIPASYILFPTGEDRWLHENMLYLYKENLEVDAFYNESLSSGIRQVFVHIIRHYELDAQIRLEEKQEAPLHFVALINYLTLNYDSATLHSAAEKFGYSDTYLGQMVKKVTGKSFTNYVGDIQLEKACELLSGTNLSITEIAQKVGCYDSSHFTNKFRRRYGETPSHYRMLQRAT